MATKRLSMRKIREILRLKLVQGRSNREAARSLGISAGSVSSVVVRARRHGLDWARIEGMDDEALEILLYGARPKAGSARPLPDPAWLHQEMKRPGVTLELLHMEYLAQHPTGYRYTSFCAHYRRWNKAQAVVMRHVHTAGEKLFVDYSGDRPELTNARTGEVTAVELFVAVLGASNFTFVEATRTQQLHDWLGSHVRAFEFFGGVSAIVVPDQLRSGVSSPGRYEPGINRSYQELGAHYHVAIIPARPRKPRDKGKVEAAVLAVQRRILAPMRDEKFFTLGALNARIKALLVAFNERPMKALGGLSRRAQFESLERPALRPLPKARFEYADWRCAKVNVDYHVSVDKHLYSVPYQLIHEQIEARITASTVEVFHRRKRVASHPRSSSPGRFTTDPNHMPPAHRKHLEWTPSRFINWAGTVGPHTQTLVTKVLKSRAHPEQSYRSCLGILRLSKRYPHPRMEAACERALAANALSYRSLDSILKNGLDRLPASSPSEDKPIDHTNIRGPSYYGETIDA